MRILLYVDKEHRTQSGTCIYLYAAYMHTHWYMEKTEIVIHELVRKRTLLERKSSQNDNVLKLQIIWRSVKSVMKVSWIPHECGERIKNDSEIK